MIRLCSFIVSCIAITLFVGCSKTQPSPAPSNGHSHDDGHDHGDHDHDHAHGDSHSAGHGGAVIELGTATIGSFTVRASRDEGQIMAGGDAPIDVWLTGGDGAKVAAVRFWIGTEAGTESIKARAEVEDPTEPNRWHTHAEVPNPIPADTKLWVELEIEGQGKLAGSFDLKMN